MVEDQFRKGGVGQMTYCFVGILKTGLHLKEVEKLSEGLRVEGI